MKLVMRLFYQTAASFVVKIDDMKVVQRVCRATNALTSPVNYNKHFFCALWELTVSTKLQPGFKMSTFLLYSAAS